MSVFFKNVVCSELSKRSLQVFCLFLLVIIRSHVISIDLGQDTLKLYFVFCAQPINHLKETRTVKCCVPALSGLKHRHVLLTSSPFILPHNE